MENKFLDLNDTTYINKVRNNMDFDNVTDNLKNSLQHHQFGVLWELNFKDKLHEKGYDFESNFKILEVCNPKQAKNVLDKNLVMGFLLPCKIVIYEEKSQVFVGLIKPTKLMNILSDDSLSDIALQVEKELISAINEACNPLSFEL